MQSPQSLPWPSLLWGWENFPGLGQWHWFLSSCIHQSLDTNRPFRKRVWLWLRKFPERADRVCHQWGKCILWSWRGGLGGKAGHPWHLFGRKEKELVIQGIRGPWSQLNRLLQGCVHSGRNWNTIIWPWFIDLLLFLIIALNVDINNSTLRKDTHKKRSLPHSQMDDKRLKAESNSVSSQSSCSFDSVSWTHSGSCHTDFQSQGKSWTGLRLDEHRLGDHSRVLGLGQEGSWQLAAEALVGV